MVVRPKSKQNSDKTKNVKGKILRGETSNQGSSPAPQAKTKKAKGDIQTRTQNLSWIANQVDAAEEKDLP